MHCTRCRDARFICELHPDQAWPHGDCAGPGLPCPACQQADERPEPPEAWHSIASTSDGPPTERGSVRPVTLDSDPGKVFYCEVRAFPTTGLRIGAIVWVNFGTQNKLEGQWRQCLVLPSPDGTNQGSGVHVKLSPSGGTAPFG